MHLYCLRSDFLATGQFSSLPAGQWWCRNSALCVNMSLRFKDFFYSCGIEKAALGLKNDPEATVKPWRESHILGCHGNIPAPHYSIIPEHRDRSLSDVEEGRRKRERPTETQRERERKRGRDETCILTAFHHIIHNSQNTEQYPVFWSGFSTLLPKIQLYIISNSSTLKQRLTQSMMGITHVPNKPSAQPTIWQNILELTTHVGGPEIQWA